MARHPGEPRGVADPRRLARERALALLYEADSKNRSPADVLADLPVKPAPMAVDLVAGVGRCDEEIDGYLGRYAKNWSVERMPAVDRALLRMAVYELIHCPDVPTGAVISEAVELAQEYSTDDSAGFVNGVLGRIADEVRPDNSPETARFDRQNVGTAGHVMR